MCVCVCVLCTLDKIQGFGIPFSLLASAFHLATSVIHFSVIAVVMVVQAASSS